MLKRKQPKVKRCPLCGKRPVVWHPSWTGDLWQITCGNELEWKGPHYIEARGKTRKAVTQAWNLRRRK